MRRGSKNQIPSKRKSGMNTIKIIKPPSGPAPLQIREVWVGLELPLRLSRPHFGLVEKQLNPKPGLIAALKRLLSGSIALQKGYYVNSAQALGVLQDHNLVAFNWWAAHAPQFLKPNMYFLFEASCAASPTIGTTAPPTTSFWTDMLTANFRTLGHFFIGLVILLGTHEILNQVKYSVAVLDIPKHFYAANIGIILIQVIINLWLLVGVWRWSMRRKAFIVFGIAAVMAIFKIFLPAVAPLQQDVAAILWPYQKYYDRFDIRDDTLVFHGRFDQGITDAAAMIIAGNPQITAVAFADSRGGWMQEGQGLGQFIHDHQLDTRVSRSCMSACTVAFLGGKARVLIKGAQLGFHQPVPIADDKSYRILADKARHYFMQMGIAEDFFNKIMHIPYKTIWVPTDDELMAAHVVTKIVPRTIP